MSPGLTSNLNLNPTPNKIKVLSLVEAAILPLYLEMESDKKVASTPLGNNLKRL